MSRPANKAAYLHATNTRLSVQESPYPTLATPDSILIKTKAVAINPVDTAIQTLGPACFTFITLPTILGFDVAGQVLAVGSGVTRFQVGDRVAGLAENGLQEYTLLVEHLTVKLPSGEGERVTWEQAATLPMGVSVSTKMLFDEELLGMKLPTAEQKAVNGETVLIWGGSTSMASCAIQLAVAAGYEVITTASPHNFDYVKKLGASQVFDYNDPHIRDQLLAAFKDKTTAGAVANGGILDDRGAEIVEICAAVVKSCPGKRFVAMTMVPTWGPSFEGVELKFVEPLKGRHEIASAVFHEYLPAALASGAFQPAPKAEVVGHGLEAAQEAFETLKKGVSAKKIVITI
ncbi:chaperonin 10-like protein [Coniella lustricola]|uniref:Chaperonin 10-like protein n=1 Tax=Coniella lustricola TaxID=2025994 RepID=A0A2T3A4V2_9PEZI|nr:chaperonin 10-like protein [Coniella lustricola]